MADVAIKKAAPEIAVNVCFVKAVMKKFAG
jgi:hypothetical protein